MFLKQTFFGELDILRTDWAWLFPETWINCVHLPSLVGTKFLAKINANLMVLPRNDFYILYHLIFASKTDLSVFSFSFLFFSYWGIEIREAEQLRRWPNSSMAGWTRTSVLLKQNPPTSLRHGFALRDVKIFQWPINLFKCFYFMIIKVMHTLEKLRKSWKELKLHIEMIF